MVQAEVTKLPKLYRKAQRWLAECRVHPEFKDYPHRTKTDAMYAARKHNAEQHQER